MKRSILFAVLFVGMTAVAQNEKVGINTDLPRTTLDVNGDATIRKVEKLSGNIRPLFIDSDGLVGTAVAKEDKVTSTIFSASSSNNVLILKDGNEDRFNSGTADIPIPVTINQANINTLGITVSNQAFKIKEEGIYEITSFVNFYIRSATNNKTFVIVTLQISEDNGVTWKNISGSRPVFLQGNGGMNHPHNIPTTIIALKNGTLVRMAFKRSFLKGSGQGSNVTGIDVSGNSSYATKAYELVIKKL